MANELKGRVGEHVRVQGFAQKIRDLREVKFLIVRDASGLIQAVVDTKESPQLAAAVAGISRESAVTIEGVVEENPSVKLGGVEIRLASLQIDSLAAENLPIPIFLNESTDLDKRTDWRFLDLREPKNRLIFQLQTTAENAMRQFWLREGFVEIHSPKLMGSPSESGAELFSLPYFGKTAYLAQSPQFYKQMGMAAGFERVFEIGPVFRANPSFTSRHDTEFTSIDMEMAWIDSHEDIMAFEERWLHHVFTEMKKQHRDEVKRLFGRDIDVPSIPFPRLSLKSAIAILDQRKISGVNREAGDLDPNGERAIAEYVKKEFGHDFVFVTDYPSSVRPFYHMRPEADQSSTLSFDLLFRGLELTTGAQREHRYEILLRQAREKGLGAEGIQFYLDFFRFGCPPHGGFGFGLTRLLMSLLGLKNVREATYLYRSPTRLTP